MDFKSFVYSSFIKLKEKSFGECLKYLYFSNTSDTLYIIFNGFQEGNVRLYNYVRALQKSKADRLYILDVWGYKGSYYLFENGSDTPCKNTLALLNHILQKGHYKHIYSIGSSKGGTAAIYFGLIINASVIIAGACQYNIGNYLTKPEHYEIFRAMMGVNAGNEEREKLNSIMPSHLQKYKDKSSPIIHLLYSKNEHTYQDDIIDLLDKLNECGYRVLEKQYDFSEHNDIGIYFKKYLRGLLLK